MDDWTLIFNHKCMQNTSSYLASYMLLFSRDIHGYHDTQAAIIYILSYSFIDDHFIFKILKILSFFIHSDEVERGLQPEPELCLTKGCVISGNGYKEKRYSKMHIRVYILCELD